MSSIADLKEELAADRLRISRLIDNWSAVEAKYTTLTEDPTTVTAALLQGFLAEIDSFAVGFEEFSASSNALSRLIRNLPGGPVGATEREALQADAQQLRDQGNIWIGTTFKPFLAIIRAEAARVSREEAEKAEAEKIARAEDIVSYRAEQNSDGSGPGDTGTWYVVGENGEIDSSGLTQQAAQIRADDLNLGAADADLTVARPEDQPDAGQFRAVFNDGSGPGTPGTWYVLAPSGATSFSGKGQADAVAEAARLNAEVQAEADKITQQQTEAALAAANQSAVVELTKTQAKLAEQLRQAYQGDWRVKLRLAPGSTYLYNAVNSDGTPNSGVLEPLYYTDGVIFPYTPAITTAYNANYSEQPLTHSNYKGYFYQSSHVGEIQIQALFTAQDTKEADYMLAMIHFFRSVTKMFYGQDAQRGVPPPLVFLQGLGEMQFNLHPCVVKQFNYSLPADVDYIRARTQNIADTDASGIQRWRDRASTPVNASDPKIARLNAANISKGAEYIPPAAPVLGVGSLASSPSYVPTKMEVSLILLPMQTRSQQSQVFSLERFANGDLQKKGFW